MRNRLTIIYILLLAIYSINAKSMSSDPRLKAIGTMAAYGTIGGALLGTATLAFESSSRSPFVGASLGLYAGMIFGGYVVSTHYMSKNRADPSSSDSEYYPETSESPYESPFSNPFSSGSDDEEATEDRPDMLQRWDPTWGRSQKSYNRSKKFYPTYYLPLLHVNF